SACSRRCARTRSRGSVMPGSTSTTNSSRSSSVSWKPASSGARDSAQELLEELLDAARVLNADIAGHHVEISRCARHGPLHLVSSLRERQRQVDLLVGEPERAGAKNSEIGTLIEQVSGLHHAVRDGVARRDRREVQGSSSAITPLGT